MKLIEVMMWIMVVLAISTLGIVGFWGTLGMISLVPQMPPSVPVWMIGIATELLGACWLFAILNRIADYFGRSRKEEI